MAKKAAKSKSPAVQPITFRGLAEYFRREQGRDLYGGSRAVARITTGLPPLDPLIGGGLPRGRVVELYGGEGCGKTSLALLACAACQKRGEEVAFIDFEYKLNEDWAKKLGVDFSGYRQPLKPLTMEQGLVAVARLTKVPEVSLIVVDSVPSMKPRAIQAKLSADPLQAFDPTVSLRAGQLSKFFDGFLSWIAESRACVVFINHTRQRMKMQGRRSFTYETTPGGDALKYFACLRLRCSDRSLTDAEIQEYPEAKGLRVKVVKTQVGGFEKHGTDFLLEPRLGVCLDWAYMEAGLASGVITRAGAWYSVGKTRLGQGREPVLQAIRRSEKLRSAIERHWRVEEINDEPAAAPGGNPGQ